MTNITFNNIEVNDKFLFIIVLRMMDKQCNTRKTFFALHNDMIYNKQKKKDVK